jgi:hypothetical protein
MPAEVRDGLPAGDGTMPSIGGASLASGSRHQAAGSTGARRRGNATPASIPALAAPCRRLEPRRLEPRRLEPSEGACIAIQVGGVVTPPPPIVGAPTAVRAARILD